MHPLVPQFILENYRAGRLSGSLQAAALFLDTSGFSDLTDVLMVHGQHGAEVLANVIRATFAPAMQSVYEQGGFVVAQAGDAFTAVFPAHGDMQDCAARAVAAAAAIQQAAHATARHATEYGEFAIQVKIGLSAGEVSWSIIAAENGRRAVFYFRGAPIDACAEAQNGAAPGEICLDREIFALVEERLRAKPVGNLFQLLEARAPLPAPRPAVAEIMDLDLAGHFYPPELFTQGASGEFRQIVFLLVSLPTVRTETQLEIFLQTLFLLQERYGGLLSRLNFGDKGPHLFLFWGAPAAFENDVQRALSFILELQTQTAIPITCGITYRIAHVGFVGSELAEDYAPLGRGANLAARFMTRAPRGEIWVDEFIAQRAGKRFELEDLCELAFKGFRKPQKVFLLGDRKAESAPAPRVEIAGRQAELARMAEFVRPVMDGRCAGVLVIWGEPGMGKSSLIEAFRGTLDQADSPAPQFFVGQCDEILRKPFNPFQDWLRRTFQVAETQGENRNKRGFNRKVDSLIAATTDAALADELDRTRSFLGALVGLRWPDSLYELLDAKGRYENTLLALIALIQAESRRVPLVFVLEDAHWLDEDSAQFLPRLLRALRVGEQANPAAFLVSMRPRGFVLPLDDSLVQSIHLERLARPALRELVEAQLAGPAAGELLDVLEERAEGNPYFTQQVLQYLKEEGGLVAQAGGWGLRRIEMLLPADIGSLLVARLDRLPLAVKEVVQTAAILGREFELALLAAMLNHPAELGEKIAAAEQAQIWSAIDRERCLFQHILLREAAYQMQINQQRQALHRRAFLAYEECYRPDVSAHYGELAYHAEQAGLQEDARRCLALAGQHALNQYQNLLAEEYFTRALAASSPADLSNRCDLLLGREAAFERQGKTEPRRADLELLEQISAQCGSEETTLEVFLRKASFLLHTGAYLEAEQLVQWIMEKAKAGGYLAKALVGYRYLAVSGLRRGQYEASIEAGLAGLALADQLGDHPIRSLLLNTIGMAFVEQNKLDAAREIFEQSLDAARQSGSFYDQAPPLNNLGLVEGLQGNTMAALDCYQRSLAIARKTGDRPNEGLVLGNLGWIAGNIGEYEKARAYTEDYLRITREVGNAFGEPLSLINLSAYAVALQDYRAAEANALLAAQLTRKIGDRSGEAWALTYLGHCYSGAGRGAEARDAYQQAYTIRTEMNQALLAAEPLAGLARAALIEGQLDEAGKMIEGLMERLEAGALEGTDEPLRVYLTAYEVLSQLGDPRAPAVLARGGQFLEARAQNIQDAETRAMFLNNIPAHRQIRALLISAPNRSGDPRGAEPR